MVHFQPMDPLLLGIACLVEVFSRPSRRLRQCSVQLRSLRHHPNGLLQIAGHAIGVGCHPVGGECERVGPKHPLRHIIHFTWPQYGKEAIGFNCFFAKGCDAIRFLRYGAQTYAASNSSW